MDTFDAAMKHVQKKGTYTPNMLKDKPVKNWINDTYSVLKKGVDAGIADNVVPDEMAAHLDHDTFLFSGFKVHAALEQAKLRLRNNDGSIKSFEKFRQDVDVIDARYNRQYLQAEYQFAISSSQSAANWTQVAEDGDTYNLQYRTAGDEAVRESHRALNGITLPSSDPFWDKFYPPNGWRCRCDAVQVRKSKHPVTDSNKAQKAGAKATTQINRKGQNKLAIFRFNPGKEQKIFPPKHPYLPKGCEGCPNKTSLNLATPIDRGLAMCAACGELKKQCLAKNKEAIKEWSKKNIDEHKGLSIQGDNFASGSMLITRGSVRETLGHTENIAVRNSLLNIKESAKKWTYLGWGECKVVNGKRKHPEAECFLYYSMEIGGKRYYANVQSHKKFDAEVLYCIREKCDLSILNKTAPPSILK